MHNKYLFCPRERWQSTVMSSEHVSLCVCVCVCVCVCLCVCLSVREHISGTTRSIFTNFAVHVAYGRGSVLLRHGDKIPRGSNNFRGCPGHLKALTIFAAAVAAAFAAKWIIQSPITSCSRRDHSISRQAQIGTRKILSAGDEAYRPGRGWWECTVRSKSDIYDCLVASV